MKALLFLAAFAVSVTTPVLAQDMDVSKISCKEFISAPKDQIGTVLTWLEGYYTKENAAPILYADKTVKDAKALALYCSAHPDDDVIKAAEAVMPVK
jgi:acid stress chaperone HdeB